MDFCMDSKSIRFLDWFVSFNASSRIRKQPPCSRMLLDKQIYWTLRRSVLHLFSSKTLLGGSTSFAWPKEVPEKAI